MVFRKTVISLVLVCSLAFSFIGSTGLVFAIDSTDAVHDGDPTGGDGAPDGGDNDDSVDSDSEEARSGETENPPSDMSLGGFVIGPIAPLSPGLPVNGFGNEDIEQSLLAVTAAAPIYDAIENFVNRLYLYVLRRNYDVGGFQYWSGELRNQRRTGANVAQEFLFSPEIVNSNITNGDFVDRLYWAMLGRGPDAIGRADWLGQLNAGIPRENIFAGFINSAEFTGLCTRAGIARGSYTPPPGAMARVFAMRLYRLALQREPDLGGLNYWHDVLRSGKGTGASVAYGFIFSPEMYNRNLSDEQFVEILYAAMLGRGSDAPGKAYWVNSLRSGATRYDIFVGFVNSNEFGQICGNHGILRGIAPYHPIALPGKVIFLDPGHGTSGSPGTAGYNEAVAMLDLARRLKPLLEAQGARVILTRDSEVNVPISVRCAIINIEALRAVRATRTNPGELAEIDRLIGVMQSIIANPGALGPVYMNVDTFNPSKKIHPDLQRIFEYTNNSVIRNNFLVISLHSNAAGSTGVRGADVFYIDPTVHANTRTYYQGFSYTVQSRAFGNTLLNHINSTGIPRRALSVENFAMIREINVPAVLAENGYHTNPNDRSLLSDPAYRQSLAAAYRNAISDYFR